MLPLRVYNPSFRLPLVNSLLLAVNLVVFFYLMALPGQEVTNLVLKYGAVPEKVWQGESWWSVLTAMFVHDVNRTPHIILNMLTLAIFGGNIEGALGHFRYLAFYLLGGLIAAMTHVSIWHGQSAAMIGASGAISAVMGAYLVIYPRCTVLFFTPFLGLMRQPVLVYMFIWFAVQIGYGYVRLKQGDGGGVAWFAHLGGFVAGIALVKPLQILKIHSSRRQAHVAAPGRVGQDRQTIL
ncbi:rhomboid family intramembrane serine protease [candidate division KSB1 bacterium]|nr:MAG: rhomboid family intramembrane serine protease [candidate division KSB1 bacterium]MCE7945300.1 rhomboid family intramembrane serine protease [Chlorobi bacterium CHB1]